MAKQTPKHIGIIPDGNRRWATGKGMNKQDGEPYSKDISRIDLIIRWGGMRRLSGLLPMQSVYADFYVEDHLWPDYRDADLINALEWYEKQAMS